MIHIHVHTCKCMYSRQMSDSWPCTLQLRRPHIRTCITIIEKHGGKGGLVCRHLKASTALCIYMYYALRTNGASLFYMYMYIHLTACSMLVHVQCTLYTYMYMYICTFYVYTDNYMYMYMYVHVHIHYMYMYITAGVFTLAKICE